MPNTVWPKARSDKLLDGMMNASSKTVMVAFEKRITNLEQDKLLIEEKAASMGAPRQPLDKMFKLACLSLASPCKV